MQIHQTVKDLGKCTLTTHKDVDKSQKYMIMAVMQLIFMCLNRDKDGDKYFELVEILKETTEKAERLFGNDSSKPDPLAHLG